MLERKNGNGDKNSTERWGGCVVRRCQTRHRHCQPPHLQSYAGSPTTSSLHHCRRGGTCQRSHPVMTSVCPPLHPGSTASTPQPSPLIAHVRAQAAVQTLPWQRPQQRRLAKVPLFAPHRQVAAVASHQWRWQICASHPQSSRCHLPERLPLV